MKNKTIHQKITQHAHIERPKTSRTVDLSNACKTGKTIYGREISNEYILSWFYIICLGSYAVRIHKYR